MTFRYAPGSPGTSTEISTIRVKLVPFGRKAPHTWFEPHPRLVHYLNKGVEVKVFF